MEDGRAEIHSALKVHLPISATCSLQPASLPDLVRELVLQFRNGKSLISLCVVVSLSGSLGHRRKESSHTIHAKSFLLEQPQADDSASPRPTQRSQHLILINDKQHHSFPTCTPYAPCLPHGKYCPL
jgi:hypothetical protein